MSCHWESGSQDNRFNRMVLNNIIIYYNSKGYENLYDICNHSTGTVTDNYLREHNGIDMNEISH